MVPQKITPLPNLWNLIWEKGFCRCHEGSQSSWIYGAPKSNNRCLYKRKAEGDLRLRHTARGRDWSERTTAKEARSWKREEGLSPEPREAVRHPKASLALSVCPFHLLCVCLCLCLSLTHSLFPFVSVPPKQNTWWLQIAAITCVSHGIGGPGVCKGHSRAGLSLLHS